MLSPSLILNLVIGCGVISVLYGFISSKQILSASPGNAKMQEIASASPVQPAYNKASLTPATQSKIDEFFGEKEFYMVLDASLKGDRDQDLRLTGQFTLEITFR